MLIDVKKIDDDRDEVFKEFTEHLEEYEGFALVAFKKVDAKPVTWYCCTTHQLPVAAAILNQCFVRE